MSTDALEVRDVCKSYHGRRVLSPVSFTLGPGECLGVTGRNGSGKSTLLKIVAQVQSPDGGAVLFQGRDVRGERRFPRRTLGYVPQEDGLAEDLTVGQQLSLWQAACGLRGPVPPELDGLLGLEEMRRARICDLSGGMRRRTSIAMALLSGPRIVVMDEATAGLDGRYRDALLDWMERFLSGGGRAVWCTHIPEEADRLCTKRLRLEEGRPAWESGTS